MLLPRRSTALVRVALPRMAVCPGALLASAVWRFCTAERSAREVVGARPERLKQEKDECPNLFCISQLAFTSATGVKTTSKALARQLNIFRARL